MRRLLPVFLVCAACAGPAPHAPGAHDELAISAAAVAWWSAGLPWSADCDPTQLQVLAASGDEFLYECQAGQVHHCVHGEPCAYSCFDPAPADAFAHGPLIVLSPSLYPYERPLAVAHETMHFLCLCHRGDADPSHRDKAVWGTQGAIGTADRFISTAYAP